MKHMEEIPGKSYTAYVMWIEDEKKNKSRPETFKYTVKKTDDNGHPYWLFYDNQWELVLPAIKFLNQRAESYAENTVIKDGEALKLLYTIEHFLDKKLEDFDRSDLKVLKDFIEGRQKDKGPNQWTVYTQREASTVNSYLSIYRQYLECHDLKNRSLSQRISSGKRAAGIYSTGGAKDERYRENLKTGDTFMEEISFRETLIKSQIFE